MTRRDVLITTPDGQCPASLHVPDGGGPWPAVLMYPDAGGLRDAMRDMGDRLAGLGYVTLIPDFYYRHGQWAPVDMKSVFGDPAGRERLMGMIASVTAEFAVRDARALVPYLLGLPEVRGSAVGVTGYCMGGRISLILAGQLGDDIAAAASFHGGNIAAEDDPASPHHAAGQMRASVYVAGATNDKSFPDEQRDRLEQALTAAGVEHTIETYPASHGFAVPDTASFDASAAERHWTALAELYASTL